MELVSSHAVAPTREVILHAMALVRQRGSIVPLLDTGDVLATACVVAAVLHPEWAAAVFLCASDELRALAEELVHAIPLRLAV